MSTSYNDRPPESALRAGATEVRPSEAATGTGDRAPPKATQVCAFGNSHLGAVKLAWNEICGDHPSVAMTFYGSGAKSLADSHVAGGRLTSERPDVRRNLLMSGGSEEVDLASYDVFFIVGGGVNIRNLAKLLSEARVFAFARKDKTLISDAFLADAFCRKLSESVAADIVGKIRSVTRAPIYVVHEPFYSPKSREDDELKILKTVQKENMGAYVASVFRSCFERAFAGQATILFQPEETIERHIFSNPAYSRGGIGLPNALNKDRVEREHDRVHRNAAFGKLIIRLFLDRAGLSRPA